MKKHGFSLILALLIVAIMLPACAMAAKTYYLHEVSAQGASLAKFKVTETNDRNAAAVHRDGKTWAEYSLNDILNSSYGRLTGEGHADRLLQDGDTLILPAGTFNLQSGTNTVYGNITIRGAGSGNTTLVNATDTNGGRAFDLYNRYPSNFQNGIVYNINLEGFTVYTAQTTVNDKPASSPYGIYLTGNNVNAVLTDIVVEGFSNHCIGVWSNEVTGTDVEKRAGVSLKLYNVRTAGTGADIKLEGHKKTDANGNALASISFSFDDACEFESDNSTQAATNSIKVDNKDIHVLLQYINDKSNNNPRVNNWYVMADGTLVPVNPPVAAAPADLPQTGDNSMLMLWAAACAMAIAAFAVMKKSYNR